MAPKRILVVTLRYPPHTAGGYELLTRNAVDGLRGRGHEVFVLCGRAEGFDDSRVLPLLLPRLDAAPDLFELHRQAGPGQRLALHFFRWTNFRGMQKALRETRPEVVLYFNMGLVSLAPLVAARMGGVPTVGYVCDPWTENLWLREMREQPDKSGRLPLFEALWKALRQVAGMTQMLAASSYIKAGMLRSGFQKDHIRVGFSGLSETMEDLARGARPALRSTGERLRVICTSMFWEGKGQHVLVEAFGRAVAEGLDGELVLAGRDVDGPGYREGLLELIRQARIEDRVYFVGMLNAADLSRALQEQHVFVLPSVWGEPFGLATIEAMAHGICTVVSDSGASPELVGDAGVVVQTGHVADLARTLLELGGDEPRRRDLGQRARVRGLEAFGRDAFIGRLEAAVERAS